MNKLISVLEKRLVPIASKVQQNRYLRSVSNGFASLLPILMIGAIFTLVGSFQFEPYQQFIEVTNIKQIVSYAPAVTTDMLSLYAVYMISRTLSANLDMEKEAPIIGALSLFSFLLLIPLGASEVQGETLVEVSNALSMQWLGAPGLFTAMIVALLVPTLYRWVVNSGLTFTMPEGVPPTVSKSFSALVPGFIIAIVFSLTRFIFGLTSYGDINNFIYTVVQQPLTNLGASPITFIIFIILCSIMWFFGIHGGLVVMPFLTVLYTPATLENLEAYGAGETLPNLITRASWPIFSSLGGAGGTLGLVLVLTFFAKSERYKSLGKLALPSGLVGINEPVTFGLPVVLNPIIVIPFILTPVITFLLSYFATVVGIIPPLNGVEIPLGTPVIFSAWLAGGARTALFQLFLILVQVAIYYPFARILDREALKEEQLDSKESEKEAVNVTS